MKLNEDYQVCNIDNKTENASIAIKINTPEYQNVVFRFNDQEIPNGYNWGPNGTFEWRFETPLITWLIYTKQQLENNNNELYIPGKQDVSLLFSKIENFKEYLNEKKL